MLHLYAVVRAPTPALEVRGLEDGGIRVVASAGLAAVVSEHAAPVPPGEETVLAHARVVEYVAGRVPALLPSRFGDLLPDDDAVRARLDERREELLAALDGVDGRVELGLRVATRDGRRDDVGAARAASGREYMTALRERVSGDARVRSIHEPLAALAERAVLEPRTAGAIMLTAAYLVPRSRVEDARLEVARLQAEHPDLALVCTGPWPPYSFAERGPEDA